MTTPKNPQAELSNEKTPEGASSQTLRLNCVAIIPQARQVILDILGEYRELDFPANPELLKLHIDAATDRLEAIFQAHQQEVLSELLGHKGVITLRDYGGNNREGLEIIPVSVIERKIGELNG